MPKTLPYGRGSVGVVVGIWRQYLVCGIGDGRYHIVCSLGPGASAGG